MISKIKQRKCHNLEKVGIWVRSRPESSPAHIFICPHKKFHTYTAGLKVYKDSILFVPRSSTPELSSNLLSKKNQGAMPSAPPFYLEDLITILATTPVLSLTITTFISLDCSQQSSKPQCEICTTLKLLQNRILQYKKHQI